MGTFLARLQEWEVYIREIGQGNSGAHTEAVLAIERLDPNVIIFVGVAGAIKDLGLGDIVIASDAMLAGAFKAGKTGPLVRANAARPTRRLFELAKQEARRSDWLSRIKGEAPVKRPRVLARPIAAVEGVVSTLQSVEGRRLKRYFSQTAAVEMEAYGFLRGAFDRGVESLLIRGISDQVEDKEEADQFGWQEVAARHASAFAFEILAKLELSVDSPRIDPAKALISYTPTAAVTVHVEPWLRILESTPKLPDKLLHQEGLVSSERAFAELIALARTCAREGLPVFLQSDSSDPLRVPDETGLRTELLALLVFGGQRLGPLTWLVRETLKALEAGTQSISATHRRVWELGLQQANPDASQSGATFIDRLVQAAVQAVGPRGQGLYRFFDFLYNNFALGRSAILRIRQRLQELDESLGNDSSMRYLEELKRLIGMTRSVAIHGIQDLPTFNPELSNICGSILCNYDFQSMVNPLTVFDYISIRGVMPKRQENPQLPFVFRIVDPDGTEMFNLLSSEVKSIVSRCQDIETDSEYVWDVPTICEWLALAGVEDQPYPWGWDQPTPERANLDYGSRSRLRPVGMWPSGASKHGVLDCCGNAHEIVRLSFGDEFPIHFRLAGGCYQTSASRSVCQVIRPFRTRREDNRRNSGLRLVRFRRSDARYRQRALDRYLKDREIGRDRSTPNGLAENQPRGG